MSFASGEVGGKTVIPGAGRRPRQPFEMIPATTFDSGHDRESQATVRKAQPALQRSTFAVLFAPRESIVGASPVLAGPWERILSIAVGVSKSNRRPVACGPRPTHLWTWA